MLPTNSPETAEGLSPVQQAVDKFFSFIDVAHAPTTVCRRIFFDVLRHTSFTLSPDEIETCEAISTLLADLERAHPNQTKAS